MALSNAGATAVRRNSDAGRERGRTNMATPTMGCWSRQPRCDPAAELSAAFLFSRAWPASVDAPHETSHPRPAGIEDPRSRQRRHRPQRRAARSGSARATRSRPAFIREAAIALAAATARPSTRTTSACPNCARPSPRYVGALHRPVDAGAHRRHLGGRQRADAGGAGAGRCRATRWSRSRRSGPTSRRSRRSWARGCVRVPLQAERRRLAARPRRAAGTRSRRPPAC